MRSFLICLAGSVATGALLVFAMPPASQGYLGWFAIAPVLLATKDRGVIAGLLAALGSVFVAAGLSLSGVPYALTASHPSQTGLPAWTFSAFGFYGFAMAISVAIFADKGSRKLPCWALAAIATLLESVLLFLLPANLGLTQYRHGLMLQLASVGGIWAVSYLVWYFNFVFAALPKRWFATAGMVVVVTALRGVGSKPTESTANVACLQIADASSTELQAAQRKAAIGRPEVAVWPELSGIMLAPGGDTTQLKKLSLESGAPLATSYRDDFQPKPHNAAALFTNGNESARYYKRQLFGGEKNMHTAGTQPVAVPWGHGALGLDICYDSCFPEAMRETARLPGVTAIALPTIDPQSPSDFFAACHAAYSPFRAAEEDVAVIRADGYAYSSIVDAGGKIEAEAAPGERILSGTVHLGGRMTGYKRFGDWFLYLCGLLVIGGFASTRKDRKAGSRLSRPQARSQPQR